MFTGIIQHRATVAALDETKIGARLDVDTNRWDHTPSHGDSISVNGCCLTVADIEGSVLRFDVIHQTLRNTTLGRLRSGDLVNIEHSLTPTTLLGGHIVQGHVDGVGTVLDLKREGGELCLRIEPPNGLMEYIVDRGSIAVDGVSLTVASVREASFEVALIPTTLALTTLGNLREGHLVNLEADYLAKITIAWLKKTSDTATPVK